MHQTTTLALLTLACAAAMTATSAWGAGPSARPALAADESRYVSAGTASPLASARALLNIHFSGDMAFTPASTRAKAAWLSPALQQRIAAWMTRPKKADEVPDINGDPFTNSQEYPAGFDLGAPLVRGAQAEVPVNYVMGRTTRRVTLVMQRQGDRWLLDDVRYGDGAPSLRHSLGPD